MLRASQKWRQMLAANSQKHPGRLGGQGLHRGGYIGHVLPHITALGLPRGPLQRQQGHAGLRAGCDGIGAHARRKRMGGVDDAGHAFVLQMAYEAGHTTEAADAHGNRLRSGLRHAPGIRQHGALAVFVAFGQRQRQRAGFGRAAQDQDIAYG